MALMAFLAAVADRIYEAAIKRSLSFAESELLSAHGVEAEIEKLKQTTDRIQTLLVDADERRYIEDDSVRLWLRHLKDVAFDADDLHRPDLHSRWPDRRSHHEGDEEENKSPAAGSRDLHCGPRWLQDLQNLEEREGGGVLVVVELELELPELEASDEANGNRAGERVVGEIERLEVGQIPNHRRDFSVELVVREEQLLSSVISSEISPER